MQPLVHCNFLFHVMFYFPHVGDITIHFVFYFDFLLVAEEDAFGAHLQWQLFGGFQFWLGGLFFQGVDLFEVVWLGFEGEFAMGGGVGQGFSGGNWSAMDGFFCGVFHLGVESSQQVAGVWRMYFCAAPPFDSLVPVHLLFQYYNLNLILKSLHSLTFRHICPHLTGVSLRGVGGGMGMEVFLELIKCGYMLLLIVISFQQILKHKQYFVHCVMQAYTKGCELEEEQTPSSSFNKQSNPLLNSTIFLESIYEKCGVKSQKESRKRVLTLPAERNPMHPQLNINNQFNYIFYVGDKIVNEKKNMNYIVEDLLGQGTFGQILLCHSSTGFKMAVKVIKCQPAYINQGLMEVKFLRAIANMEKNLTGTKENYLNVYDAFKWKGHICTAMEVMDNSLLDILKEAKYEGIQMKWIEIWTKKLLFSLAKIHRLGIMHCDIKPENVMFRPEQPENPLFIDFSSGCESSKQLFTYIQSRYYRAPEVLLGQKPYTDKIDIWSMGCLLAELYLGLPLFPGFSSYDQLHKILRINEIEILSVEALETVQFAKNYFNIVDVDGTKIFKLKDIEQFENETGQTVALNENYFYFTTFDDMLCYRDPTENEKPTHELFINLIKQMLKFDADQRISAEKAFLHPFTGGLFSELDILNQIVSQEKQTQ